jgi:DNA-directed RNA polymerase specialized sigma24 family protein
MIVRVPMVITQGPLSDLTRQAFERLLERLGPDREAAAREYETVHRRLVELFDWQGVTSPEVLADETVDRVARKLDEGVTVEHLRAYCYGVGRNVLLEWRKRQALEHAVLLEPRPSVTDLRLAAERREARVECLESCLRGLPSESRDLIVGYYSGTGGTHLEGRRVLAERLGISYGALKTRAHRIRTSLEECLRKRLVERDL